MVFPSQHCLQRAQKMFHLLLGFSPFRILCFRLWWKWMLQILEWGQSFHSPHYRIIISIPVSSADRNYNIGDWELLAIKVVLERCHHWLERAERQFIVWTDTKSLNTFGGSRYWTPPSQVDLFLPVSISPCLIDVVLKQQRKMFISFACPCLFHWGSRPHHSILMQHGGNDLWRSKIDKLHGLSYSNHSVCFPWEKLFLNVPSLNQFFCTSLASFSSSSTLISYFSGFVTGNTRR